MNERVDLAAPPAPAARPSASLLPFAAAMRIGLASGLVSHLPWLLTSRVEALRGVSTLMPFVFLALDPWLTVPLALRVRRGLVARARARQNVSSGPDRGHAVFRAACAGIVSGSLTAANIVAWERIRLGAWLQADDLAAHLVYPALACVYAVFATSAALLLPRRPGEPAQREAT